MYLVRIFSLSSSFQIAYQYGPWAARVPSHVVQRLFPQLRSCCLYEAMGGF
jgi:hypothetical protein